MSRVRPAAGGGRWVEVEPARMAGWLERFAARHGGSSARRTDTGLFVTGADGGTADCQLPLGWPPETTGEPEAAFAAAATYCWRVGLLLVRRGAHAIGVADGERLVVSKVDTQYVQGRTAAGGWSQQRFARRRDKQTRESAEAAAEHAARVLATDPPPEALVPGGDRAMVDAVLADKHLERWADLPRTALLDVPEPRAQTLIDAAKRYRAVRVLLRDA